MQLKIDVQKKVYIHVCTYIYIHFDVNKTGKMEQYREPSSGVRSKAPISPYDS
jgi:hypothetical protein